MLKLDREVRRPAFNFFNIRLEIPGGSSQSFDFGIRRGTRESSLAPPAK
jgi:hypothetical protein